MPVLKRWSWLAPLAALAVFAAGSAGLLSVHSPLYLLLAPPVLIAAVFAAVRHAETVSIRLGETAGAVVLALAVTAIEVGLIGSVMIASPQHPTTVARNTVFAGVMVVLNGVIGVSLLLGAGRWREQTFEVQGTTSALAVLGTLAAVTMILPSYTVTAPGPYYTTLQLAFVAVAALVLYGVFLFAQAVSQKHYFASPETARPRRIGGLRALASGGMLLVALVAVVVLADSLTPTVQRFVTGHGMAEEMVSVVIATLVLLPEGSSAVRAAWGNRLQTSLNFALGSAIASTGLTIPAIALFSALLHQPIDLGLAPEHIALLITSLFAATLTLSTGRTTVLQGAVHLVIFVVFLVIAAVP
ncbi:MAG: hypothetical protein U1E34_08320 [Amaricoccus sp.]